MIICINLFLRSVFQFKIKQQNSHTLQFGQSDPVISKQLKTLSKFKYFIMWLFISQVFNVAFISTHYGWARYIINHFNQYYNCNTLLCYNFTGHFTIDTWIYLLERIIKNFVWQIALVYLFWPKYQKE